MTEEKFHDEHWVYAGQREGRDGKPVDIYRTVLGEGPKGLGPERVFPGRKLRTIGGVYVVEVTEDGARARIAGARYIRNYEDKSRILEWRGEHDAYVTTRKLALVEKKSKDLHLDALAPLRSAYQKIPFDQRAALEVAVLNYLRRAP